MRNKLIGAALCLLAPFTSLAAHFEYDYIIVGLGNAGSFLARKLSDSHKKKVLVLEAGINHNTDPLVLEAINPDPDSLLQFLTDTNPLNFDPAYSETYVVPGATLLNPNLDYSEGKGWGGGGMHNTQLAVRGSSTFYNNVAALSGNPLWNYENMLPLMQAMENYNPCQTAADLSQRGEGGPLSITQFPPVSLDPVVAAFANTMNAGFVDDYNNPSEASTLGHTNLGLSAFQVWATQGDGPCTTGRRSFAGLELFPASVVTPGGKGTHGRLLDIESNCYVTRVIFKGHKAVGVEFVFGKNGSKSSKAYGKKIILCAGAFNTPAILMRSGIGDPAILEPLGIKVVVNNPNVGLNLQSQYGAQLVVTPNVSEVAVTGFTNASGFPTAPFNTYPDDNIRRLQFFLDRLVVGPGQVITAVFPILMNPIATGSVRIVSPNQFDQVSINLNLFGDTPNNPTPYLVPGSDANLLMTGVKLAAQAITSIAGSVISPQNDTGTLYDGTPAHDAQLWGIISSGVIINYHSSGTARMAPSIEEGGVVDGFLNVFGVKNLMIADTSVLPIVEDGNPGYSAYMVGLRAATFLGLPVPPAS